MRVCINVSFLDFLTNNIQRSMPILKPKVPRNRPEMLIRVTSKRTPTSHSLVVVPSPTTTLKPQLFGPATVPGPGKGSITTALDSPPRLSAPRSSLLMLISSGLRQAILTLRRLDHSLVRCAPRTQARSWCTISAPHSTGWVKVSPRKR